MSSIAHTMDAPIAQPTAAPTKDVWNSREEYLALAVIYGAFVVIMVLGALLQ